MGVVGVACGAMSVLCRAFEMFVDVVNEQKEWQDLLGEFSSYDFVHTYDFHRLSQLNGEGEPVMYVLKDDLNKPLLSWQVLKRPIDGTPYFDLSSVYGYGGPLLYNSCDLQCRFDMLWQRMKEDGAISLFSRMHPFFIDSINLDVLKGQRLGDVVMIDVGVKEGILSRYRGSHRREIVNALSNGLEITVDWCFESLGDFYSIYRQSMLDLHANDYYVFGSEYFSQLVSSKDFKVILIFADFKGQRIAASMFIVTGEIMQYYLSGTVSAYRKIAASKAIIAKAHELASDLGLKVLILGGGVGSEKDALYNFKCGFSKITKPFYITKKILNNTVYDQLCAARSVDPSEISFFPAYRG